MDKQTNELLYKAFRNQNKIEAAKKLFGDIYATQEGNKEAISGLLALIAKTDMKFEEKLDLLKSMINAMQVDIKAITEILDELDFGDIKDMFEQQVKDMEAINEIIKKKIDSFK